MKEKRVPSSHFRCIWSLLACSLGLCQQARSESASKAPRSFRAPCSLSKHLREPHT